MEVFAVALNLSPLEIVVIAFTMIFFVVTFGIASAKGEYKDLITTTLRNDEASRNKKEKL